MVLHMSKQDDLDVLLGGERIKWKQMWKWLYNHLHSGKICNLLNLQQVAKLRTSRLDYCYSISFKGLCFFSQVRHSSSEVLIGEMVLFEIQKTAGAPQLYCLYLDHFANPCLCNWLKNLIFYWGSCCYYSCNRILRPQIISAVQTQNIKTVPAWKSLWSCIKLEMTCD